jgi:hypothetical protein
MTRRRWIAAAAAGTVCVGAVALLMPGRGSRSLKDFDPDRMAALETDMWQAYYMHENVRLFRGLLVMLHEQYRYSWGKAAVAGFHLARAASTFSGIRTDYDRVVPDLERAYGIAREWTGSSFDPARVARAELAWWVARRVPGQDDAAHVGALIAEENALLFGVPAERVLHASTARAEAGRLRDDTAANPDWAVILNLLTTSYRELHAAVN